MQAECIISLIVCVCALSKGSKVSCACACTLLQCAMYVDNCLLPHCRTLFVHLLASWRSFYVHTLARARANERITIGNNSI